MCSKYTWWISNNHSESSSYILCSYPLGQCINDECICAKGQRHDMILIRQRDCLLSEGILPVYHYIYVSIASLCIIYSIINLKDKTGEARTIIGLNILSAGLLLLLGINEIINNYIQDQYACIILLGIGVVNFISCYRFVFMISLPLFKLARADLNKMEKTFRLTWLGFRLVQFVPCILGLAHYGDPKKKENDDGFNGIVCYFHLTVGIETTFLSLALYIRGYRLVGIVQSIIDKSPKDSISASTRMYVTKTRSFLKNGIFPIFSAAIGYYLIPCIYFVYGYIPYAYIFYMILTSTFFIGIVYTTVYFKRNNNLESKHVMQESQNHQELSSKLVTSVLTTDNMNQSLNVLNDHSIQQSRMPFSEMTTVQSVTNIVTVSDPVLLKDGDDWRSRENWIEVKDNDGLPCYFNTATKEWSFDPPSCLEVTEAN